MAVLTVSEFEDLKRDSEGNILPIPAGAPLATQAITLSGSSQAVSNPWDDRTNYIRIAADGGAHIAFAASPTATTSNELWPSGLVEFRALDRENMGTKLAAINAA